MLSLVERGGLDPEDYAHRIARIFVEGRIVGRGRTTTEAAMRLARGVAWQESGTPAPAAGNGSAMRAGPIGLFYWNRRDERIRSARDQGRITHADPRCSAGAVTIAGAVALALRPEPVEASEYLGELAAQAEQVDGGFAAHVRELAGWIDLDPDEAAPRIAIAGVSNSEADPWDGISPFVVASVLWSLYAFLRSPDDYWEAVRLAIGVGGDVDTTAAMTGAISGARLGIDAVPLELAVDLSDQGTWDHPKLLRLAHRCHAVALEHAR